jgi:quercetin dioxygenase-like cupin family protein
MATIFTVDQGALPWSVYHSDGAPSAIRFKALTPETPGIPPMQFIEYGPGQADPVHHHDTGEVFIVTEGELWVGDDRVPPGGVIFIPAYTDDAVRAGDEVTRYFRIVVP